MTTITFDTLKFVKQLEASGVPTGQAEAFVLAQQQILSDVLDSTLATRQDLLALERALHTDIERVERKLIEHDGKFALVQWMLAPCWLLLLPASPNIFSRPPWLGLHGFFRLPVRC
jgi:hypothetical protein